MSMPMSGMIHSMLPIRPASSRCRLLEQWSRQPSEWVFKLLGTYTPGQVSPASAYAGAIAGGAAGGVAATLCGPACAGAVAGATSNLVRSGLTGNVDPIGLIAETGAGALSGAALGQATPYVFKTFVPNTVKGNIGEGLTELGLTVTGQSFERQVPNSVPRSSFDFGMPNGSFLTAQNSS